MLSNFLRKIPIYVKVSTDRMEAMRLDTGKIVAYDAAMPFSNSRIVFAHFIEAEDHLKSVIRELIGHRRITPNLKIVIQQMERTEGGLSSVERRALVDSCEHAGAIFVKVVDHERPLTRDEALQALQSPN